MAADLIDRVLLLVALMRLSGNAPKVLYPPFGFQITYTAINIFTHTYGFMLTLYAVLSKYARYIFQLQLQSNVGTAHSYPLTCAWSSRTRIMSIAHMLRDPFSVVGVANVFVTKRLLFDPNPTTIIHRCYPNVKSSAVQLILSAQSSNSMSIYYSTTW